MNDQVLVLEKKDQPDGTVFADGLAATPDIDENYWLYRVRLSDTQAMVAFPKFGTIGIGFAREEDWNTNLPYLFDAEKIYAHIQHNKYDVLITEAECLTAIRMLQEAIRQEEARE